MGEILSAISHLYSSNFQETLAETQNPYGNGGASEEIVEQIEKFIQGQKITEKMLVDAQFGFINANNGLKFQLYTDDKVASIVFVGEETLIRETLKESLEAVEFKYISYDEKERTILFEDKNNQSYLLYLYPYTQNGPLFSDMSNWRNFFREEQ